MEATNPWVVLSVALIGAFGGKPLFDYLVERSKHIATVRKSERDTFEQERAELKEDRKALESYRQRLIESERLELRTLRSAFNEVTETNGRLSGMLASANERIDELEAEVARLRGNGHKA